jgi:hypothetical protein
LQSGSIVKIVSKKKAASNSSHSKKKATPGPKAERLKLKGDWRNLVKKSLSKEASGRLAEIK